MRTLATCSPFQVQSSGRGLSVAGNLEEYRSLGPDSAPCRVGRSLPPIRRLGSTDSLVFTLWQISNALIGSGSVPKGRHCVNSPVWELARRGGRGVGGNLAWLGACGGGSNPEVIGCAGAGPQKARGSLLLKVFRGVDLVVARGARAGTPSYSRSGDRRYLPAIAELFVVVAGPGGWAKWGLRPGA